MKNTLRITTELAKQAVMTELLLRGHWIAANWDIDPACSVCAVGAVLRHHGVANTEITRAATYATLKCSPHGSGRMPEARIHEALAGGHYMSALSIFFESFHPSQLPYEPPGEFEERRRAALVEFIDENFPESFEAEIDL